MDRREFDEDSMPGSFIEIGSGRAVYSPDVLPPQLDFSIADPIHELGLEAMYALGRLREIGNRLEDPRMIQLPFIYKEALDSSEIEGTAVTLPDLYTYEMSDGAVSGDETPTADLASSAENLQEVANYIDALEYGTDQLEGEIGLELIKEIHRRLLGTGSVRSQDDTPGELRESYARIGSETRTRFRPPSPDIAESRMQSLEQFIRTGSEYDKLIDLALIHYQIETIHPFSDGNGRVGRLLVALLLDKWDLLPGPYLHLSGYLKRNKREYTDRLLAVSQHADWEGWLSFFLQGIRTQATDACSRAVRLLDLREEFEAVCKDATPSARALVEKLFTNPVLTANRVTELLDCSPPTAYRALEELEERGIVTEVTGNQRNQRYHCTDVLAVMDAPPSVLDGPVGMS